MLVGWWSGFSRRGFIEISGPATALCIHCPSGRHWEASGKTICVYIQSFSYFIPPFLLYLMDKWHHGYSHSLSLFWRPILSMLYTWLLYFLPCVCGCASAVRPCSPQQSPYLLRTPPVTGTVLRRLHHCSRHRLGQSLRGGPAQQPPAGSSSGSPSWCWVLAHCCLAQGPPCPCSTSARWVGSPTCWGHSSSQWGSSSWPQAWCGSPCSNAARSTECSLSWAMESKPSTNHTEEDCGSQWDWGSICTEQWLFTALEHRGKDLKGTQNEKKHLTLAL